MPVANINSGWSSGNLVFYEAAVGRSVTGDVLTIGTTAVTIGGTSQDIDFGWYASGSKSFVLDAGLGTLTMAGIDVTITGDLTLDVEDLKLGDGQSLEFGDADGGDIAITFTDGAALAMVATGSAENLTIGDDTYAINVTLKGTLTVGKSDTGHDVIFYGATAANYFHWDESEDDLILVGTSTGFIHHGTTEASAIGTASGVFDGGVSIAKKLYVGTDLVMVGGDIDLSTAVTGTYDLILKTNVADALSIKDSAADLIVFTTTTGSPAIAITPATSITGNLTANGRVIISNWGSTYTASALTVGAYGTPIADTALTDNILASINGSTATEKTADDTSCMALFVGMRNTALTDQPHTKLQGILISTLVYANCFDAYGVQGHVAVKADATAVAGGTNAGNICGGSFKATVDTAMTATGTVSGALITLDGAGTVTGTHSGLWIDATVSCDNGILISSTGTMTTGISFGGTITSLFEIPAATTGGANGGGADVYVDVTIGGVAARLTGKYVS